MSVNIASLKNVIAERGKRRRLCRATFSLH